jgi:hypothetical protein
MHKHLLKKLFVSFMFVTVGFASSAQTTLSAGDIAFTAYNSASNGSTIVDTFSFILLKNISSGTSLYLTDNGWKSNNTFRTGEGALQWTASSAMQYGDQVKITCVSSGATASAGSVSTYTIGGFSSVPSLSTGGDQIIAFTGSSSSPTFIAGIHWNRTSTTTAAAWDTTGAGTNSSTNPLGSGTTGLYIRGGSSGLTITNAIAKTSAYNADAATFRSNLSDTGNWIKETSTSTVSFSQPPAFNTGNVASTIGYWTWIHGDTNVNNKTVYGTKGLASATAHPGGRYFFASATDKNKSIWVFGGSGFAKDSGGFGGVLSDLWNYNTVTNKWTWVSGDSAVNKPSVGIKGVASTTSKPGGRTGASMVIDSASNIYIIGGTNGSNPLYNDVWKYEPSTQKWTWLTGDTITNYGKYGIKNTFAATNIPPSREEQSCWIDKTGIIWMFGGLGYGTNAALGAFNDLWKFDPATNLWAWVAGDSIANVKGVYGTRDSAAASNKPGARYFQTESLDADGNLIVFGGLGWGRSAQGDLNDVWKFDLSLNKWIWKAGDSTVNKPTNFGQKNIKTANATPGGRTGAALTLDKKGNFLLHGGNDRTDVWMLTKLDYKWIWIAGDSAVTISQFSTGGAKYGIKGVASATNRPGYHNHHGIFLDSSGKNMLVFAGDGRACGNCSSGALSDLWTLALDTCNFNTGIASCSKSSYCGNDTISLTMSSYDGTLQWQKNTGSGWNNIGSTNANPLNNVAISTSTSYRAFITSSCGNDSSNIITLNQGATPTVGTASSSASTVCTGSVFALNLSSFTNGTLEWQWKLSANSTWNYQGNTSTLNLVATSANTYNFRALITGGCGKDSSNVITVAVTGPPATVGTASTSLTSVCDSGSVNLAVSAYTQNLQWQKNTGSGWTNIGSANANPLNNVSVNTITQFRALVSSGCNTDSSNVVTVSNNSKAGPNTLPQSQLSCSGNFSAITGQTLTGGFSGIKEDFSFLANNTVSATNIPNGWSITGHASLLSIYYTNSYNRAGNQNALRADFFNTSSGATSVLETKSFGPSISQDSLRFDIAYASYGAGNASQFIDTLRIYADSGAGFTLLKQYVGSKTKDVSANGITTAAATTSTFIPTDTQWTTKSLKLPLGTRKLRFEFKSAFGNEMYLDRIIADSILVQWLASTSGPNAGFGVATGNSTGLSYLPTNGAQPTWYKRVINSGVCGIDTSNATLVSTTPAVLYVDSNVTVSGNGNNWATAFKTLQEAMHAADKCSLIDTIRVAKGTYTPDNNRDSSFFMIRGLVIEGGYPTGGGNRNIGNNPTILDGSVNGEAPRYHVLVALGCDSTAIVDGFTIQNGVANGSNSNYARGAYLFAAAGGGMLIQSNFNTGAASNPLIRNCIFKNDSSNSEGGAIYNIGLTYRSSPSFINCSFLNNVSVSGGGGAIYNQGMLGGTASPLIQNCYFYQNHSDTSNFIYGSGGAISIRCMNSTVKPIIRGCTFEQNYCKLQGGAIYIITGNGGNSGYDSTNSITSQISNCIFKSNSTSAVSPPGYDVGGGAIAVHTSDGYHGLTVTNTQFYNNKSDLGGAIFMDGYYSGNPGRHQSVYNNCTFFRNSANLGEILFSTDTTRNFYNNIQTFNNSILWQGTAVSNAIVGIRDEDGTVILNNCIYQGDTSAYPIYTQGTYFSSVYPNFTDSSAASLNLQLKSISGSAINHGDSTLYNSSNTTDLASNIRIQQGQIDLGCYESPYTPCLSSVLGTASSSASSVCNGGTINLSITSYTGNLQWQANTGGGWNNIGSANTSPLNNISVSANTNYRAYITGTCSNDSSNVVSVSLATPPSAGTASSSATTVCSGSKINLSITSYTGNLQWQANTGSGWNNIGTINTSPLNNITVSVNTNYRAYITGTCSNDSSNVISVSLTPAVTAGTASSSASSVCNGNTINLSLTSYTGSLQWQSNTGTGWNNMGSANTNPLNSISLSANTNYRAYITGSCNKDSSNVITVFHGNSISNNTLPNAIVTCPSSTFTISGSIPSGGSEGVAADFTGFTSGSVTNTNLPGGWSLVSSSATGILSGKNVNSYGRSGGNGAFAGNFFSIAAGSKAVVETKSFGPTISGDSLKFDIAYSGYSGGTSTQFIDTLRIYADSGAGFKLLKQYIGSKTLDTSVNGINTSNAINTSFTPSASQWTRKALKLPTASNKVRFEFISAFGNQMYIDRVTVDSFIYKWLSSTTNATSGFSPAAGNNTTMNYSGNTPTQSTWYRRYVASGSCGTDTSAATALTTYPSVLYVDSSVTSSGAGNSWSTAFKTVQEALMAAGSCNQIDTVRVAKGTYTPDNNIDSALMMVSGLVLEGNYPSGGGNRNMISNKTILDGRIAAGQVNHILIGIGLDSTTVLDGFTIQYGNAKGLGNANYRNESISRSSGGGLYNTNSSNGAPSNPIITNCIFQYDSSDDGGAIMNFANRYSCNPTIINCLFDRNAGKNGAAITTKANRLGNSMANIQNCIFTNNNCGTLTTGFGYGSAIYIYADSATNSPKISNCEFNDNAGRSAAITIQFGSSSVAKSISSPIITNSKFKNNFGSSNGGAICINGSFGTSYPIVNNCLFYKNTSSLGGAIYADGNGAFVKTTINNSSFFRNQASAIGDILFNSSPPTNTRNNDAILNNCILWLGNSTSTATSSIKVNNSKVYLKNCISENDTIDSVLTVGTYFNRNYPSFADTSAASLDLSLTTASLAAINKGDSTLYAASNTVDLNGNARIQQGQIDLGCYESPYTPCVTSVLGTASSSATTVCNGSTINLSLTSYTGNLQWQANTGSGWNNIGAANTSPLNNITVSANTDYRAYITGTCSNDSSNIVSVSLHAATTVGTASSSAATVCNGNTINLSLTAYTGSLQWQSNTGSGWNNIGSANSSPLNNISVSANTDYRAYITGTCSNDSSNVVSVSLYAATAAGTASSSAATVCNGNTVNLSLTSYTGNLQWQSNTGSGWNNIGAANTSPLNNITVSANTDYRAYITGTCSNDSSNVVSVSVYPATTVGTASSSAATVCNGSTINLSLTSYTGNLQWQANTGSGWNNIGSVNSSPLNNITVSANTDYRAYITGTCSNDSSNVVSVSLYAATAVGTASSSAATVCNGSTINLSLTAYTGNLQWQANTGSGWNNIGAANSSPLNNISVSANTNYRAYITGTCSNDSSNVVSVSLYAATTVGTASSSAATVCNGSTINLSLTSYTGNLQWQANTGSGWNNIGSINSSPLNNISVSANTNYRAYITGTCSNDSSNVVSVSLYAPTTVGAASSSAATVCNGSTINLSLTAYTGSLQWQANTGSGWNNIGSVNTSPLNNISVSANTNYRAYITGTCSNDSSNVVSVSLYAATAVGTASSSASTVCNGSTINLSLTSYTGNLQWQANTGSGWNNIGSVNSSPLNNITVSANTDYRAYITGTCSNDSSNVVSVSLYAATTVGTASSSATTVCNGNSVNLSLTSYTGNLQWQANTGSGWNNIGSVNTSPLNNISVSANTNYRAYITGTCSNDSSNVVSVSLYAATTVGSASSSAATVCNGSNINLSLTSYTGNLQWQSNTGSGWNNIGAANTSPLNNITVSANTNYRAYITGTCSNDSSNVVPVSLYAPTTVGTASSNLNTVCLGNKINLTLTSANGTIQWQSNTGNGWNNIGSSNSNPLNNITVSANTNYRAYITGTCSNDSSNVVAVNLYDTVFITSSPSNATIVAGKVGTYTIAATGSNLTYQWQEDRGAGYSNITNAGIYSGAANSTLTLANISVSMEGYKYRCIVSGPCNTATSAQATLSVVYAGVITSSAYSICAGTNVNLQLTGVLGTSQVQKRTATTWSNLTSANTNPINNVNLTTHTDFRIIANKGSVYDTSAFITVKAYTIWTGASDTSWVRTSNWCNNTIPLGTNHVLIPSGVPNYPSISSGANCADLAIDNGATVIMNSGSTININGIMTCAGTFNARSGTVNLNKASGVPAVTFNILKLMDVGNYNLLGNVTVKSTFQVNTATTVLNMDGYKIGVLGDPTINGSILGNGQFQILRASGTATLTGNCTLSNVLVNTSAGGGIRNAGNVIILDSFIISLGGWQINNGVLTLGATNSSKGVFINNTSGAGITGTVGTLYIYGDNLAPAITGLKVATGNIVIDRPNGVKLGALSNAYTGLTLVKGNLDMNGNSFNIGSNTSSATVSMANGSITTSVNAGALSITSISTSIPFNNLKLDTVANFFYTAPANGSLGKNFYAHGSVKLLTGDIDLNGFVVTLGSAASITENAGQTFKGNSGYITTTRSFTTSMSANNVAGLGLAITTNQAPGLTTITRGHNLFTSANGKSIRRYFGFMPANDTGLVASFTYNYDSSELASANFSKLRLYQSINNGNTWTSLTGGTRSTTVAATGFVSRSNITVPDAGAWFTVADSVNSPLVKSVVTNADMAEVFNSQVYVYPNPFEQQLTLSIKTEASGLHLLKVLDMNGKVLTTQNITISSGENSIVLNLEGLAKGMYLLQLQGAEQRTLRIIKL